MKEIEKVMKSTSKPCSGRVVAVMSPMGGDGRTTLCANISAALTRLGKRTIVVDSQAICRIGDDLRALGDFILIDTPPGCAYGEGLEVAAAADSVILVVMPWLHTVRAAESLIRLVRSRHAKQNMRLVTNCWRPTDTEWCDLTVGEVFEILRLDHLGVVPNDDYVVDSTRRGELAALNPESTAGQEYRNIARRLLDERNANDDLCIESRRGSIQADT